MPESPSKELLSGTDMPVTSLDESEQIDLHLRQCARLCETLPLGYGQAPPNA